MVPDHLSIPTPCVQGTPSHPYQASLASSASSSSSSVFSIDALSQSSQSSVSESIPSGYICDQIDWKAPTPSRTSEISRPACLPLRTCTAPVAPEQRQHPRRRSVSSNAPPTLVRQSDRKGQFVDCLVDSATQMVEVIWPTSVPVCGGDGRGILPLRTFIQETLRRSRTSFSTLQVALYYLILIKIHIPGCDFTMEQPEDAAAFRALQCGRRMFLAALILASKYLQDRNYSARAWSKISGLKVCEINLNEMAFLRAVSWQLHIKEELFDKWQDIILQYTPQQQTTTPACWENWKALVRRLNPDLEGVEVRSSKISCKPRKAATWPISPPSPVTPTSCNTPTPLSAKSFAPSTSNTSTPTPNSVFPLPRFLEPRPDLRPPTPVRLGPLPTPCLTPQSAASSSVASTPAVSVLCAQRPSMRTAMQVCNAFDSRMMMDPWTCNPAMTCRRPCLAPTNMSMSSSPESMVSDASSRSSRASSISSASSVSSAGVPQACNATHGKLARLATLRCAGMNPTKEPLNVIGEPEIVGSDGEMDDGITIEPMSSPDFEGLNIHEVRTPSMEEPRPQRTESPAEMAAHEFPQLRSVISEPFGQMQSNNRKRGRSSADFGLHQNVRDLLVPDARAAVRGGRTRGNVAEDDVAPSTCILSQKFELARRPAVQKDGRKRVCCAQEAKTPRFEGPGMWEGVL